jgi:hypothetical protein
VRGVYTLLTSRHVLEVEALTHLLWHKQVPLKVFVLAWRLLRNRLPTRDNLVQRHIITPDSQLCVTGCGGVEITLHPFFSCSVFASLWHLICNWVGTSAVDPYRLQDHFVQFVYSTGGTRARRSFLQLLWLCCI